MSPFKMYVPSCSVNRNAVTRVTRFVTLAVNSINYDRCTSQQHVTFMTHCLNLKYYVDDDPAAVVRARQIATYSRRICAEVVHVTVC